MAAVTAATVKELREMTGAGMMDCKKALAETDGDMDKAIEFLREKGLAGAEKKAGRTAVEGLSLTCASENGKKAAVVEVNIETDFAANTDKFKTSIISFSHLCFPLLRKYAGVRLHRRSLIPIL